MRLQDKERGLKRVSGKALAAVGIARPAASALPLTNHDLRLEDALATGDWSGHILHATFCDQRDVGTASITLISPAVGTMRTNRKPLTAKSRSYSSAVRS